MKDLPPPVEMFKTPSSLKAALVTVSNYVLGNCWLNTSYLQDYSSYQLKPVPALQGSVVCQRQRQ